ncbi:MAG: hypothetical protein J6P61_04350 [Erysipelotrichaceae bacterium]|nr:hypothetical protein [Erysipelotrichaceae bacterium]
MIYAVIWFVLICAIYFTLYILNHRTPAPEGCEFESPACAGCHNIACTHRKDDES